MSHRETQSKRKVGTCNTEQTIEEQNYEDMEWGNTSIQKKVDV